MGIADELLTCLPFPETVRNCQDFEASLDGSLYEMKQIYQERIPYTISEVVGGLCLEWDEMFLVLCRYAMSTDCMDNMTSKERELWRMLVDFEDAHSWSATTDHCRGLAGGVTDPRLLEVDEIIYPVKSYPLVYTNVEEKIILYIKDDGSTGIMTTPDIPYYPDYCFSETGAEPTYDVPKSYVYDDLDGQFYKIHDCLPYNTCGCDEEYILEHNDCHNPGDSPSDPDAIFEDLYKTGCGTDYCVTIQRK
jgi:hypothetical protein